MPHTVRCFIAIDIDAPDVVNRIIEIQRALQTEGSKLKAVEAENLHLTLFFLGEQPPSVVERVREVMLGISFKPFTIKLQGIGAFPSNDRPRVVWVGIAEGFEEVRKIYYELRARLRSIPIRLEPESSFTPHITLARVKFCGYALRKTLMELKDVELGAQEVKSVKLKKSTLTPRGPVYETMFEARG
ncbi:MAG: RNA 2',3'-cyclic phosphodiesterase [Candidatus Nezhaarchaeota archaeon]|nr:RNA 2',3'-cyclic phosphodiesterase [Candidatus Nezhaarchaeota archaeon]